MLLRFAPPFWEGFSSAAHLSLGAVGKRPGPAQGSDGLLLPRAPLTLPQLRQP